MEEFAGLAGRLVRPREPGKPGPTAAFLYAMLSAVVVDDDPLDGLDDVPWGMLLQAYGTAQEIPDLLRAIKVGASDDRNRPISWFWNHIVHQGTQSEAAVFTVPFLVRLALDPSVADRHDIVQLLMGIAIGGDYNYLPHGYDLELYQTYLADFLGEVRQYWRRWVAETPDENPRGLQKANIAQAMLPSEAIAVSYDAVRDQLATLTTLLNSDSAALRAATAYLLAWFPEDVATTSPLLSAFIAKEQSPGAAAIGLVALGLLGDLDAIPFIRRYIGSDATELRWAAAFALSRLHDTSPGVVEVLTQAALELPGESDIPLPFLDNDFRTLAAKALAGMPQAASATTQNRPSVWE